MVDLGPSLLEQLQGPAEKQNKKVLLPYLSLSQYHDLILNEDVKFQYRTFISVPVEKRGLIFLDLPENLQEDFGGRLKIGTLLAMFKFLDPDEVRDIIAKVPPHRKEKLYEKLDKELKKKVEFLLQFDQSKAAGLMSLNYVIVGKNTEPKKLYQKITRCIEENSLPPHVLVRDRENHIIGYIPTKHLILKRPKTLEKYIEKAPIVRHYEDHQKLLEKFKNEEHEIVVITDEHKHILGIVEYHDLLKQLEKDETERIYQFAGVQKEEDILDPPLKKFKSRAFWLILNLFTAFLAAGTIGLFEETISSLVLLAMYMPIIAGMGGNAATQTLAVVIRGIVMHNIDLKRKAKVVLNEVLAGIGNGVINGILVAIVATLWNNMPLLGLVVFLSMVANLIIAAFFGTIIPFILEKLKIDPAVAATVFVTTATDVFGFFIFLGLAQMILL